MTGQPTVIRLASGVRATVSHRGVPGAQGADGDPGEVQGPVSSVLDNIAVFADTSGEVIKDGGTTIAAIQAAIAAKVDIDGVKVLSDENFTTAEKAKLAALFEHYRGRYDDEAQLVATLPVGDAEEGDYAFVVAPVADPLAEMTIWFWDHINSVWTMVARGSTPHTAAEIEAELATDTDYNKFTDFYRNKVDNSVDQTTFDIAISAIAGDTAFAQVYRETTTARVLSLADMGAYCRLQNVAGCAITVDNTATVLWPAYPEIRFRIATAGPITLVLGSGVTVNNSAALAGLVQEDNFSLKKIDVDEWDLVVGG